MRQLKHLPEADQPSLKQPRRSDAGWTFEQLLDWPHEGGYDIDEEGRLHKVTGDPIRSTWAMVWLLYELYLVVVAQHLGMVYPEPSIILDPPRRRPTVAPDVAFVSTANLHLVQDDGGIEGNPDMVIEVVSPGNKRRKWLEKLDSKYRAYRMPELWLVYPKEQRFLVLCYHEGAPGVPIPRVGLLTDYVLQPERADRQPNSRALPGIQLNLASVFRPPTPGRT